MSMATNISSSNDFLDNLQVRVNRLLQTITNIDKEKILNIKKNRGAFPKKIIRNVDAETGRKTVAEVPYTTSEIFAVYLLSDSDGGMEVYERSGNVVDGMYKFQVELLFYGSSSPFIATQFILNSVSEQVRLWMQYAEMSWSVLPSEIETMDAFINNEWWIVRKLTLKLNVGIRMEFPKGELIDTFQHSVISLGGIDL